MVMFSNLHDQKAYASFVIRDSHGYPIIASTKFLGHSNVLCIEAFALITGLQAALIHQAYHIKVDCDSKVLIDCINNKINTP